MERAGTFRFSLMAVASAAFVLSLSLRCMAETAEEAEFAALQSDANKAFKEGITPFINNYCTRCHGQERQKGGINFGPALKSPGETASNARWKQAIAAVKSHDMPPEDAKQPSEEEREKFLAGLAKIKFLSS